MSGNGIPFDVVANALEFRGIPNPVIERFVLPKRLSSTAQSGVDITSRNSLDRTGNLGERNIRVEQNVHVIGHDDVSMQQEAAALRAAKDRIFGIVGELRIGQPERTSLGGIEGGIKFPELLSGIIFWIDLRGFCGTGISACPEPRRARAVFL